MSRRTDPVSVIPSATVVRQSLGEAQRRVTTLAFLLGVAEGVEEFGNAAASSDRNDLAAPYQAGRRLAETAARKKRPIDVQALVGEVASHA